MRINDVIGIMVSVFMDWTGALANLNCVRIHNSIAWRGFEPAFLDDTITRQDVVQLATSRQYTFQISTDGSLIQLLYRFDAAGTKIVAARLAYYGIPSRPVEPIEDDLDNVNDAIAVETHAERVGAQWLRMDYDPAAAAGVLHGDCHLHISGLPAARFLVSGVPTPKQFVEFIFVLFYPELYRSLRLAQDGSYVDLARIRNVNDPSVSCGPTDILALMTHIKVPLAANG